MQIEIRADHVRIIGYVNVAGRDSKLMHRQKYGPFIERVMPKTFERALHYSKNVDLLFNHKKDRKLGSTQEGTLTLWEDNIGLRAMCTITDPEVIKKAKQKKLSGWSFSFNPIKERWEPSEYSPSLQRRCLEKIELIEVSILDNKNKPAYETTSIEMRSMSFDEIAFYEKELELLKLKGGILI